MNDTSIDLVIRPFRDADEEGWLRCRVLSLLHTDYFDDVLTVKPRFGDRVDLVATANDVIVGLMDITMEGHEAVLESVAVHPDHHRRGIATALLTRALEQLRDRTGVTRLEAWTRDDPQAAAWYTASGFVDVFQYVHVYADGETESADAVDAHHGLLPMKVFLHGKIEDHENLRSQFNRVHVCRCFQMSWG